MLFELLLDDVATSTALIQGMGKKGGVGYGYFFHNVFLNLQKFKFVSGIFLSTTVVS